MKDLFVNNVLAKINSHALSESEAFCIDDKKYSYRELFNCIAYVQNKIEGLSSEDTQLVGIVCEDSILTYASILALWFRGSSYVPLHPKQPEARHKEIIKEANITCIISEKLNYENIQVLKLNENCENNFANSIVIKSIDDSALAYILFTSGSTGKPKGVPISRGNVAAFIESMNDYGFSLSSEDKFLQPFDLTFDISVFALIMPLLYGGCIYTIPLKATKFTYIANLLDLHNLTFLPVVPSMIRNLNPYLEEINTESIKYTVVAGEAFMEDVLVTWQNTVRNSWTINMYGPTENTVYSTGYSFKYGEEVISNDGGLTIGKDLLNSQSIIIDEKNDLITEANKIGELCLSGSQLTSGYCNNENENSQKFFHIDKIRYYRSGDLCFYNEKNLIMYVGRLDSQVQINGYRVELSEIEGKFKNVSNNLAIAIPYRNRQNNLEIALIVESEEYDYSCHKKKLINLLPEYMCPSKYLFLEEFPLNTNGKIDRKLVKQICKLN